MTLCEKIRLIDDMVRENPDATIKDYMELMGDLNKIERATSMQPPLVILKQKKPRKRKPNTINAKYLNNYRVHF